MRPSTLAGRYNGDLVSDRLAIGVLDARISSSAERTFGPTMDYDLRKLLKTRQAVGRKY